MPRSNGSIGSTTAACWSRSATCHRPKPKRPTTGSWRNPSQSLPESNETASEEVGTVQWLIKSTSRYPGIQREIAASVDWVLKRVRQALCTHRLQIVKPYVDHTCTSPISSDPRKLSHWLRCRELLPYAAQT